MKLIIGLGNPEPEYSNTRHNIGKDILSKFCALEFSNSNWSASNKLNCEIIKIGETLFCKPGGYMNSVGEVLSAVSSYYKVDLSNILVIYDELDLEVGFYKLAQGKGSRIHNGILSINSQLKSDQYWHCRVGVRGSEIPMSVQKSGRDPSKYVLERFPVDDQLKITEISESKIFPDLKTFLNF